MVARYKSGEHAELGDIVSTSDRMTGTVVGVADLGQFMAPLDSHWSVFHHGVFVETKEAGLVHYPEPQFHLTLKERRAC